jgi:hypothetical protein
MKMPTVVDLYNETTAVYNKKCKETFDMMSEHIKRAVSKGNYSATFVLNDGENHLFEYQWDAIQMILDTWVGIGYRIDPMDHHIITFSWDEIDVKRIKDFSIKE